MTHGSNPQRTFSTAKLLEFFRFLQKQQSEPIAVRIFLEEVDSGSLPERVLRGRDYTLKVKKLAERVYSMSFGCNPGPMTGDGGSWEVEFDRDAQVKIVKEKERWIS